MYYLLLYKQCTNWDYCIEERILGSYLMINTRTGPVRRGRT